jgi:cardiolipin synthase
MKTLLLVIYILTILCVIFLERKSPTEAILWVLVLICLPYAGMVLYLIFGSTIAIKITAYARKKRLHNHTDPAPAALPELSPLPLSEEDKQVIRFNTAYNQSRLTCYEALRIYTAGEPHYRQLFADIAAAKECIYIEFYTIHPDLVGKALVDALTQKAREGVRVLVMCDFIANMGTPPKMFRPLKEAGGSVVRIKPFLTHYRSHRKIVVIDHRISYIGGMNIGRKYVNLDQVKTPWRDTQVRLEGPCAEILDEYFLTDWLCSVHRRDRQQAAADVDALPEKTKQLNPNLCQFIVGGVDTNKESVKMCYLSMIRSAKKSIRIQTPYFIPDASILDALKAAAAAGVQIELMIPGVKASFFLDPVTTYYCGELLEYGAKIYKYHGYIHAKTMVVDDELCCIGSVNMDIRSLQVDDEICGVFYANPTVTEYSRIYDEDITHCEPYTLEQFHARTSGERFVESFFLMFAPLM